MDKNLDFLTKVLVDEAVLEINKKGIPPKREGRGYLVSIGNEKYPFKLIVTEAAKIAGVDLTSKDFKSSKANRNGFQKITDYTIINLGEEMEYFDLKQIAEYKKEVGKPYDSNSPGAKCYNNTRLKLQYLGKQLGELFSVDLINNYNEKPNKMAGYGKGFVQKEYILTGFIPKIYHEKGNQIFIKLIFARFSSEICFGIDIDVNFSDENNPFNQNREALQNESQWTIKVDENFPTNWEDLLDVISPIFEKQLKILDTFFSQKATIMNLNNHLNILRYKKQIILQGPPGTGKTREAKLIAKEMLGLADVKDLKDNDQFKLIQFHPSYTYEDFIRGIVAKPNPDGDGVIYEAENKTLGAFAKKAMDNFINSTKDAMAISEEIKINQLFDNFVEHLNDEIENADGFYPLTDNVGLISTDDENAFRYKGKNDGWLKNGNRILFKDLLQSYLVGDSVRKDIKKNNKISGLARQHASYFVRVLNLFQDFIKKKKLDNNSIVNIEKVELKNFILIIDEINRANLSSVLGELIYALEYRGEAVESMYNVDGNELILPPNLYIIGTMNTADRSVGHIDYAIRRRFAFVDVLPKELSNNEDVVFDGHLFSSVKTLFTTDDYITHSIFLSKEFDPKDVALGHSYFIDKSDEEDGVSMTIRLEYEIKPILLEYVKDGVLIGDDIKQKIKDLKTSL